MNRISSWAIRNPVPTTILFFLLTLSGLVAFPKLRLNDMPDMEIPTVTITVTWAGAAPTEIETQITRLIEDSVAGLGNADRTRSTINEGVSVSDVEFPIGTDIDRAMNDVRDAVMSIRSELPQGALDPVIQRVEAIGQAILTYTVDAPTMAPDDLSWFIDNDIAKAALAVPGVSRISRAGGVDAEITVKLDPDRLMALGLTAFEIGLAVVATTFAIIVVFAPVGLMPGIPGQFFKAFSIAVCSSVFFSLVVARLLTPLMAAFLLKATGRERREPAWVRQYTRILSWTLRHRWITISAGVVFFLASLSLVRFLPAEFMPPTDRGRSVLTIELAPGATLQDTDVAAQKAASILMARPEVASVYSAIGTETSTLSGPGDLSTSASEVRKATVTVNMVPRGQRTLSQQEFEALIGPALSKVPGARIRLGEDGSSGAKIQISLLSDDPQALAYSTRRLVQEMRATPGLYRAGATSSFATPELQIIPKKDKAAAFGVPTTTIARTVNIATVGDVDQNLSKFSLGVRQIPIRVLLNDDVRTDLSRLSILQVPAFEEPLPLSSVADITFGSGPIEIKRIDRIRSEAVEAELSGITVGEAEHLVSNLPSIRQLPESVTYRPEGDSERMQELFGSFTLAVSSGIVLLFLVLALLFNGFIQPVTILTALPLSLGGALGLLILTQTSLSLPVFIGILMLMGIAAKNSILLVEYAIVAQRDSGFGRAQARLDAARKRARPIVMTTVAMGAGMLPIALGIGADAESRAPMAVAVIGGLITSTILSLVYVPAFFTVMDDLERWIRKRFGGSETLIPHARN